VILRPSIYNFSWVAADGSKTVVFNALTRALVETEGEQRALLEAEAFDTESLPLPAQRLAADLAAGGFFVEEGIDEVRILKYNYFRHKYAQGAVGLTLAPTMACNFACPYCYERPAPDGSTRTGAHAVMNESVQRAILDFVAQPGEALRRLGVAWYGGEPLLAPQVLFPLSEKLRQIADSQGAQCTFTLVTNGYLLDEDPDTIPNLSRLQFRNVQVTLDGPPEVHNCRRRLKGSGQPTFGRIMSNVRRLVDAGIETTIRVNVDRENRADAERLLDCLEAQQLHQARPYLGRVETATAGCQSVAGSCVSVEEFARQSGRFLRMVARRGFAVSPRMRYPARSLQFCGALRPHSFVIDPDGDLYKCWNDVGDKDRACGNIVRHEESRPRSQRMEEIRYLTWDPFEYDECRACRFLPICLGGCPAAALRTGKPQCREWRYRLEEALRDYYVANSATG